MIGNTIALAPVDAVEVTIVVDTYVDARAMPAAFVEPSVGTALRFEGR